MSFAIALDQPGTSSYVLVYSNQEAIAPITPAALLAGNMNALFDSYVASGSISQATAGIGSTRTVASLQDAT